jgi:hypothetical protein
MVTVGNLEETLACYFLSLVQARQESSAISPLGQGRAPLLLVN